MERNVSLNPLKRWCWHLPGLACLIWSMLAWAAEPQLVLVAGGASPLQEISPEQARRLYLGIPVVLHGHEITPLRNLSDRTIQEVFLQRVLYMSAQAYERQMAARIFRGGGNELRSYGTLKQLSEALGRDPWAISYMSADTAAHLPDIKILGGL